MKRVVLFSLSIYQLVISRSLSTLFGNYQSCRFYPSCSAYTKEAVERFGVVKGAMIGIKRLLSCHPQGGLGIDPVPQK